jgi:hypothetical protein
MNERRQLLHRLPTNSLAQEKERDGRHCGQETKANSIDVPPAVGEGANAEDPPDENRDHAKSDLENDGDPNDTIDGEVRLSERNSATAVEHE